MKCFSLWQTRCCLLGEHPGMGWSRAGLLGKRGRSWGFPCQVWGLPENLLPPTAQGCCWSRAHTWTRQGSRGAAPCTDIAIRESPFHGIIDHRMVWVGSDLKTHLVPPLPWAGTPRTVQAAPSPVPAALGEDCERLLGFEGASCRPKMLKLL